MSIAMSMAQPKFEVRVLPITAEGFSFSTNTYLITRQQEALLVDPAGQAKEIEQLLAADNLQLKGIVITHAHLDHIGAVGGLSMKYELPAYAHATANLSLNIPNFRAIDESSTIELAGESIQVIHTPGHSPDSICLQFDDKLISGDTLFKGTCGRTDFAGGSASDMHNSLAALAKLDPQTLVFPGHGSCTTIGDELNKGLAEY